MGGPKPQNKKQDQIKTTTKKLKLKEDDKKSPPLIPITVKLDQDTVFVNVGEPTTIKIVFNPEFEFLDLEEKTKPAQMILDVPTLSFMWTPQKEDAGYNNLSYLKDII